MSEHEGEAAYETYQRLHERNQELEAENASYEKVKANLLAALGKAKADSARLDTLLSWHGVDWFFAWFKDADNTNPPTRKDIDKLEE